MNIKILDSWLREYLKTEATAQKLAEVLSLTSLSVDKTEKIQEDYIYDIEVTTNRPDVMSVIGIAREATAALNQFGISATFLPYQPKEKKISLKEKTSITIKNDPNLVHRICAIVLDINMKNSPLFMKKRLETTGIRSLNNVVDVTNYVMREIGHPAHAFDYDRLDTKTFIVRESKPGEQIVTLDKKRHILSGGDIVADNGKGEIIDLLGIMGTENSVVTEETKRILFFIDNSVTTRIRKTSMSLGIRSEAAILNEKGVDRELAKLALLRGIELYMEVADAKPLSQIIDIYPTKIKNQTVSVAFSKIDSMIGLQIPKKTPVAILNDLGFETKTDNKTILCLVPTWRSQDVTIEEDIIEEIARIYGYHKLPNVLPMLTRAQHYHVDKNNFFWEKRIKNALKYWGFTEVYTYSLVSEDLFDGPIDEAVTLTNPLTEDMVFMRRTIVPSLLKLTRANKTKDEIRIFEIANVYERRENTLPQETLMVAGLVKGNVSFYEVKGIIEQLAADLGIKKIDFKEEKGAGEGSRVYIQDQYIGEIEVLEKNIIDFELNFEAILKHVSLKKTYKPISKYPPVVEDLAIIAPKKVKIGELIAAIKSVSKLIVDVTLLDRFEDTRTFHVVYHHEQNTLTTAEVAVVRKRILGHLKEKFNARLKE